MQKKILLLLVIIMLIVAGCTKAPAAENKPAVAPKSTGVANLDVSKAKANENISTARQTPIVQVAHKVGPAVVGITNKGLVRDIFNRQVMVEQGTGSGVIFDASGLIVTNYHVVANAREIAVSLTDGRSVAGKVLGVDPATDLAVVKISAENLPVAEFGDSDSVLVGEPAIAIGNPLGLEFKGSVTVGVISALNRSLDIGERTFKLLQTDAAINPGNSGGALANADGKVIGINSAKINLSGVEGIGFAIPINAAKPILAALVEKGRVLRAYLGVGLIDRDLAAKYGYEFPLKQGILVARVDSEGPAYQAGLRKDDVIISLAGNSVNSVKELRSILDKLKVGSTVGMDIVRQGVVQTLDVTLTEMPLGE